MQQTFKSAKIIRQERNLLLQLFVDGYIEMERSFFLITS